MVKLVVRDVVKSLIPEEHVKSRYHLFLTTKNDGRTVFWVVRSADWNIIYSASNLKILSYDVFTFKYGFGLDLITSIPSIRYLQPIKPNRLPNQGTIKKTYPELFI